MLVLPTWSAANGRAGHRPDLPAASGIALKLLASGPLILGKGPTLRNSERPGAVLCDDDNNNNNDNNNNYENNNNNNINDDNNNNNNNNYYYYKGPRAEAQPAW